MNQRASAQLAGGVRFLLLGTAVIWLTHTIVFFAHEYAHSTAAWLLGCKSNPLDLEYGKLDLTNVLLLSQMVLVVLGHPTAWAMWHFFARIVPDALSLLAPGARWQQAVITLACVVMMFGYFGASGFSAYGEVSRTLSGISILAVPGIAAACWPARPASPAPRTANRTLADSRSCADR